MKRCLHYVREESLSYDGVYRLPHTSLGRSPESCKIISMMSAEKVFFGKIKFLFAWGSEEETRRTGDVAAFHVPLVLALYLLFLRLRYRALT